MFFSLHPITLIKPTTPFLLFPANSFFSFSFSSSLFQPWEEYEPPNSASFWHRNRTWVRTIHTNSQSSLFFLIDLIQVHVEKQDREKGEHQLNSSELQMCSPKKKKGVLFWWVDLFIVFFSIYLLLNLFVSGKNWYCIK